MSRNFVVDRLFRYIHKDGIKDIPAEAKGFDFNFKFFSDQTPYLPLFMVGNFQVQPFSVKRKVYWNSRYYMEMINKSMDYSIGYCLEMQTRSLKKFAIGPGMIFHIEGERYTPLMMVVIPNHMYDYKTSLEDFITNHKKHIEVFFHNDIRSINQSLWNYIRKYYIESLELEGLRFSFKHPNTIYDLTTVNYQKPKFSSIKELKEYKQAINEPLSFEQIAI